MRRRHPAWPRPALAALGVLPGALMLSLLHVPPAAAQVASPRIVTIAGTGTPGAAGDGGPATSAQLNGPLGLAVDSAGSLYVADYGNDRIRKISGGTISTFYTGWTGHPLKWPVSVAVDAGDNVFVVDQWVSQVTRIAVPSGTASTYAGGGCFCIEAPSSGGCAFAGDGGPATAATLGCPSGIAFNGAGDGFVASPLFHRAHRVLASDATMSSFTGTGVSGYSGDGGVATLAQIGGVVQGRMGVAVDGTGNVYLADRTNHAVRKIAAGTGVITTVAGTGIGGFTGDGGPATSARLNLPRAVAVDAWGNLYIADTGNHRVRKVSAITGMISTVAGTGAAGYSGDDGPASLAQLNSPSGLSVDGRGNLYIADTGNHRVRSVGAPPPAIADLNGDGRADRIVYRPSVGMWWIEKSGDASEAFAWGTWEDRPVPGDYDGDGKLDIAVYRPYTGTWFILESASGYTTSRSYVWGTAADVPVPGNYDGDGKTDIAVWRPATGRWYVLTSSSGYTASASRVWGMGTDIPVPGDYDGDGITDFAVYRPSTGTWYLLDSGSGGASSRAFVWGAGADRPVPGDYDGDGTTDLAVWRPATGTWYILQSAGGFVTSTSRVWGAYVDWPVPGDYDGDGATDLAVFRPATGTWYILHSGTGWTTSESHVWGNNLDMPIGAVKPLPDVAWRGDVDGDRRSDLTVWRPATGAWSMLGSSVEFLSGSGWIWGTSDQMAVPGDYDGDGRNDPAVWRESTGQWDILESHASFATSSSHVWGTSGDIPVPADYDGDRLTDIAVWRPSTGRWEILESTSGFTTSISRQWGQAGDVPAPGDYDGDGYADLVVWRPSTLTWHAALSGTGFAGEVVVQSGTGSWPSGWVPVPGDYDGDGATDYAIYSTNVTGRWVIYTSGGLHFDFSWGNDTMMPVPGDYFGDGQMDPTVWEPATGKFYVLKSLTIESGWAHKPVYVLGASGDQPLLRRRN